jgi:hypothetical protein
MRAKLSLPRASSQGDGTITLTARRWVDWTAISAAKPPQLNNDEFEPPRRFERSIVRFTR